MKKKKHRHVWWLWINHRYQNLNFVSAFKTGLVVPCPFISVKTTITWECAFFQFGEKHDIIFFHLFRVMCCFFLCLISILDHLMDFILFVLSLIHDILNTTCYILWVHNVCPYFLLQTKSNSIPLKQGCSLQLGRKKHFLPFPLKPGGHFPHLNPLFVFLQDTCLEHGLSAHVNFFKVSWSRGARKLQEKLRCFMKSNLQISI